ncbi:hypothetical protein [Streptomyces sp. NRRL WC-3549]|nr:hypothetical protein [Streptomyces sp. NRRL WC-3549]
MPAGPEIRGAFERLDAEVRGLGPQGVDNGAAFRTPETLAAQLSGIESA